MPITRRQVMTIGATFVAGAVVTEVAGRLYGSRGVPIAKRIETVPLPAPPPPIARAAPLVYPEREWWWTELNNFLDILPDDGIGSLKTSLWPKDTNSAALSTHSQDVHAILKQLNWVSNNVLTYKFKDEWHIHYHALV